MNQKISKYFWVENFGKFWRKVYRNLEKIRQKMSNMFKERKFKNPQIFPKKYSNLAKK